MPPKKKYETDKAQMGLIQKLRLKRLQKKIGQHRSDYGKWHKDNKGNPVRYMSLEYQNDPKYVKWKKKFKELGGDEVVRY